MGFLGTLAFYAVKFVVFVGLVVGGFIFGTKLHDRKAAN